MAIEGLVDHAIREEIVMRTERKGVMRNMRMAVMVLAVLLPNRLKRVILRRLFHWEIDGSAHIGLSVFVNVKSVYLGPHAQIGHFNVFRNLQRIELQEEARIGQWNWMTAAEGFLHTSDATNRGRLIIGPHAAVTLRHYLDCAGGIEIGAFSTVAGVRSTLLTHQIDIALAQQSTLPIAIGEYCFIGSDVRLTPGTRVPDRCVIAMGAVVAGELPDTDTLYGGVPARPLKHVGDGAYFRRESGYVQP